jgi:hypothetical protein
LGINFDELIDNILIENKKQIATLTKKESRNMKSCNFMQPNIVRNPVR